MSFERTHLIPSDCPAVPLCVPLESVTIQWEILFSPYLPTGGDGVSYSRTHHGVNNSR